MMIFNCITMYFYFLLYYISLKSEIPHSLCLKIAQLLTCSLYSAVLKFKN